MDPKQFIEEKIREIREVVGKEKALVALSGGVDSSVVTVLAHRAIGDQLIPVFIDNGLMREGEGEWVRNTFAKIGIPVIIEDTRELFLKALSWRQVSKGWKRFFEVFKVAFGYWPWYLEEPEEKREWIEWCFYGIVIPKLCKKYGIKYWLQGTIKTDIEETQAGWKLQHNVRAGLNPKKYGLPTSIQPLSELRKNEVKEVARALDLPAEIIERQPFLGPGLACRIIGEVTPEKLKIIRKATSIVEEEFSVLCSKVPQFKPFQYFSVLLNDRATGTRFGQRAYGNIIALRCIDSEDARTAAVTELPWFFLKEIERRIINEIPEVIKVVYDLSPKPPSTIEWE